MKKRITIIGINYYPEDSAIGLYTSQLAEYFQSEGIEVKIITGFPYYPSWEISAEYQQKKLFLKERINGIDVFRYKQYVPKNPSFIKRIIHLLDFTFGSMINIFYIKKTDVVLCIVPFTSTIIPGKILSKLRKAKLWVHIQDFEFDAASDASIINKKNILLKALFSFESMLFNNADAISTISNAMLNKLLKKSKKDIPKYLLPNWVDVNRINPDTCIQHEYLKSNKFKILYSGNIGEKQDWKFYLEVAKRLEINTRVDLVVVGDGGKKEWLINKLKDHPNVKYYEPVVYNDLSNLLCSADVHILFQKDNIIDTVMPSKILAMMASQKPSIITGNLKTEVATIITESKGGFYFESNNIDSVLSSLHELFRNKDRSEYFGANARNYVIKNFSSEQILDKFKQSFDEIIQKI